MLIFFGITKFQILFPMLHIDLNANKPHNIYAWENRENVVLLDLAHDSCFPPSLNALRAVTRTKTLQLPCLLFCCWCISRTNHEDLKTEWMVSVCMCTLSLAACMMKQPLHDCGVHALRSGTCRLHVEIEVLRTQESGAVRSASGWGHNFFAQAALKTPVEFNLKCVQLNYLQRTVHGRVDFHLFQSCSLTNISPAAPPPMSPWPACFHGNTSSDKTKHVMLA